jgi:hypothetical protein
MYDAVLWIGRQKTSIIITSLCFYFNLKKCFRTHIIFLLNSPAFIVKIHNCHCEFFDNSASFEIVRNRED